MNNVFNHLMSEINYFSNEIRELDTSEFYKQLNELVIYFDEEVYWNRDNFSKDTRELIVLTRNKLIEVNRGTYGVMYGVSGRKIFSDLKDDFKGLETKLSTNQ